MSTRDSPSPPPEPKRQKAEPWCQALKRSIEQWNLLPPYQEVANEDQWAAYYAERTALDFRHEHFLYRKEDEDGDEGDDSKKSDAKKGKSKKKYGEEIDTYPLCFCLSKPSLTEPPEPERDPPLCSKCGRVPDEEEGRWIEFVKPTEELNTRWAELVDKDPVMKQVYGDTVYATHVPKMRPHCHESYAESCHSSGTTLGQYEDFRGHIQNRIKATLSQTTGHGQYADYTASGLYILSYWVGFEEPGIDARPRTVEFSTRLYSPIGNGESIDLSWYYHFRTRRIMAHEKYSILHALRRSLVSVKPMDPTSSFNRRHMDEDSVLAILDGDSDETKVHKKFATLNDLKHYRSVLFGKGGDTLSTRKVFGLLARAAGAQCVSKQEVGWIYAGMRKRYELFPGEESDGEEDGNEDGPECIIS